MHWVALFSHTGNEIANISNRLTHWPDKIVTNNCPGLYSNRIKQEVTHTSNKPSIDSYRDILSNADIITLHGWMRIIPGVICEEFEIYNLHPGLITSYPELKGKDPQSRVLGNINSYDRIGCVIHRVTKDVDCGNIEMERSVRNDLYSEASITRVLHGIASDMWVDFLMDRV